MRLGLEHLAVNNVDETSHSSTAWGHFSTDGGLRRMGTFRVHPFLSTPRAFTIFLF